MTRETPLSALSRLGPWTRFRALFWSEETKQWVSVAEWPREEMFKADGGFRANVRNFLRTGSGRPAYGMPVTWETKRAKRRWEQSDVQTIELFEDRVLVVRENARRASWSHSMTAQRARTFGLTPVAVFFGTVRPRQTASLVTGDFVETADAELAVFVGQTSDGRPMVVSPEAWDRDEHAIRDRLAEARLRG